MARPLSPRVPRRADLARPEYSAAKLDGARPAPALIDTESGAVKILRVSCISVVIS